MESCFWTLTKVPAVVLSPPVESTLLSDSKREQSSACALHTASLLLPSLPFTPIRNGLPNTLLLSHFTSFTSSLGSLCVKFPKQHVQTLVLVSTITTPQFTTKPLVQSLVFIACTKTHMHMLSFMFTLLPQLRKVVCGHQQKVPAVVLSLSVESTCVVSSCPHDSFLSHTILTALALKTSSCEPHIDSLCPHDSWQSSHHH